MDESKYQSPKENNSKKFKAAGSVILLVFIVTMFALVLSLWNTSQQEDPLTSSGEKTEHTLPGQELESSDLTSGIGIDNYIQIDTRYGTLYFPQVYEDNLMIEVQDGSNKQTVVFYCVESTHKEQLFTLSFGAASEFESKIGVIHVDDGTVDVNLSVSEFAPQTDTEKKYADLVYAMLEALNDVVDHLEYIGGYESI